jgi:hypothetical protein
LGEAASLFALSLRRGSEVSDCFILKWLLEVQLRSGSLDKHQDCFMMGLHLLVCSVSFPNRMDSNSTVNIPRNPSSFGSWLRKSSFTCRVKR